MNRREFLKSTTAAVAVCAVLSGFSGIATADETNPANIAASGNSGFWVNAASGAEAIAPWAAPFQRYSGNPVLNANSANEWESGLVYNPTAIQHEGRTYLFYRAENIGAEDHAKGDVYVSRIGLATSTNGVTFTRQSKEPVLALDGPFAEWKKRGTEDPRVTKLDNGLFVMTYTAYKGRDEKGTYHFRLFIASSRDLKHWTEHGPVFDGKMKSAAIIPQKIRGKYWMYYGDSRIRLASSDDGLKWNANGQVVLAPRPEMFDHGGVETGPAPFITPRGILLFYNGYDKGHNAYVGTAKAGERYSIGAVLFDPQDPAKVIARTSQPLLSPEAEYELWRRPEQTEVHRYGTLFTNGAVVRDGKIYLYYGAADASVCVAVAPLNPDFWR